MLEVYSKRSSQLLDRFSSILSSVVTRICISQSLYGRKPVSEIINPEVTVVRTSWYD